MENFLDVLRRALGFSNNNEQQKGRVQIRFDHEPTQAEVEDARNKAESELGIKLDLSTEKITKSNAENRAATNAEKPSFFDYLQKSTSVDNATEETPVASEPAKVEVSAPKKDTATDKEKMDFFEAAGIKIDEKLKEKLEKEKAKAEEEAKKKAEEEEGEKIAYTYKPGDTFGQVLLNLGLSDGTNLWGPGGDVEYYTQQLIEQGMLDERGNVKLGIPFYLRRRK